MNISKKYIFLSLMIAMASLFTYNLLSSPSNNINNQGEFKKYTNTEYGFEFEYPSSFELKEDFFGRNSYSKFNIVVNPKSVRTSNFTVLVNVVLPEFSDNSFKNIEKTTSKVTIDGIQGVKYEYEFEGWPETSIILPLGEYKIILATDAKQHKDVFNHVLDTFKFLD